MSSSESPNEGQLTEFLGLISSFDDERPAIACGLGRIAELLSADGVVLVAEGETIESTGFHGGAPPAMLLKLSAEPGASSQHQFELPETGLSHVALSAVEEEGRQLIVVRSSAPFDRAELELLEGTARVLALSTRALRLLGVERGLRAESERHGAENIRLLGALRDRQVQLERLGRIQRSIVAREPLYVIFEEIVAAICDLLEVDSAGIRLRDRDADRTNLVAAVGPVPSSSPRADVVRNPPWARWQ